MNVLVLLSAAMLAGIVAADEITIPLEPVGRVRVAVGSGCKVERTDGALLLDVTSPQRSFAVRFFHPKDWNHKATLSPKIPRHDHGSIAVDFTSSMPLNGIFAQTVDGKGSLVRHEMQFDELASPGAHALVLPLAKGDNFVAALGEIGFVSDNPVSGSVALRRVSFRGELPVAGTARLDIDTGCEPHVLTPNTRESGVVARLVNASDTPQGYSVIFRVLDYCGNVIWDLRNASIALAPQEAFAFKVPCPDKYGVYRLEAEVRSSHSSDGGHAVLSRSFAYFSPAEAIARRDVSRYPIGADCHLHPYFLALAEIGKMADAMRLVGFNVMRTDAVARDETEWRGMDEIVEAFTSRGLELDLILPIRQNPGGVGIDFRESQSLYRSFFSRWKGRVKYWELWNEPDLPWGRKVPPTPEEYARLAHMTRGDLRELDPAAQFMSAGFCVFNHPVTGEFQKEAMRLAWKEFDYHCFHGHGHYGGFRRLIDGPFMQMRREIGIEPLPWFANETAVTSAECGPVKQAEMTFKKFLIARSRGARGYIWYNLRSKGIDQSDSENGYGLLTSELDPKPAYVAWNTITSLYGDEGAVKEIPVGAGFTCFVAEFTDRTAACIWRDSRNDREVEFETDAATAETIDMFGNRQPLALNSGRFKLKTRAEPVSILMPAHSKILRVQPADADKTPVLEDKLSDYVEQFNSSDEELYVNTYPNKNADWFMLDYVPLFECPDNDIERTYYFRWWTYRKHLRKTAAGWVVTEFLPPVGWAGAENTISCAMGHHLREGRWLRSSEMMDDYTRFMLERGTVTGPSSYVCWPAWSTLERMKVSGNSDFAVSMLPKFVKRFEECKTGWTLGNGLKTGQNPATGLFSMDCGHEGTECALSVDGARAMVNSAMWAEASAISRIAEFAGDKALMERFRNEAETIANAVTSRLWRAEREFFTAVATNGSHDTVRELHGYAPFYFRMSLTPSFRSAWKPLMREDGFSAKWGLTFPERSTPGFVLDYKGHECKWNGPSWPYATSIALTALYETLHEGRGGELPVSAGDFVALLKQYAAAHVRMLDDGRIVSWIDENQNPFTGDWISRTIILQTPAMRKRFKRERGKDYNHSTFCDLVISGLCGLVPHEDGRIDVRPLAPPEWDWWRLENVRYHGKNLTILFDRDGTRYGRGKGLIVLETK